MTARIVVSAAVAAVLVSGCGGQAEPTFTPDRVSSMMTEPIREQLPTGTRMDPLECVRDGDDLHFTCVTTIASAEGAEQVSVSVVCDETEGRCVSRQS